MSEALIIHPKMSEALIISESVTRSLYEALVMITKQSEWSCMMSEHQKQVLAAIAMARIVVGDRVTILSDIVVVDRDNVGSNGTVYAIDRAQNQKWGEFVVFIKIETDSWSKSIAWPMRSVKVVK